MRKGSTLQTDRLPDHAACVYEQPVKLEPPSTSFLLWQGMTTLMWGYLGSWFGEALPVPVPLLPVWVAVRMGWPLILGLFALALHKHYAWVCTAELLPDERARQRGRLQGRAVWQFVLLPVLLPWAALCALRHADELCRAWVSWFVYNRQQVYAVGLLRSPVAGQPARVWAYRLTVFLLAATTLDTIGLLTALVPSLVIAPSLGALREARRA